MPELGPFDIRFLRKGKHSTVPFLPPAYLPLIGLVVVHWGLLETFVDVCLSGLIETVVPVDERTNAAGWRMRQFKRRARLLRDICKNNLASRKPEIAREIIRIVNRSTDLKNKRDLIVHGHYTYTLLRETDEATNCRAVSADGKRVLAFDEAVLNRIYHEIAHLSADLFLTMGRMGKTEGPFHSLPDTELLQAYRDRIRTMRPSGEEPPSPPPPSQE